MTAKLLFVIFISGFCLIGGDHVVAEKYASASILGTLFGHFRDEETILRAPSPTNWGDWGPFDSCSEGDYVFGMQLKTHGEQGAFGDDTALNGVKLFCKKFHLEGDPTFENDNQTSPATEIFSHFGGHGSWGSTRNCSKGGVATGFQMRFEDYGGWFVDDTAANNMLLYCNGQRSGYLAGDGTSFGEWKTSQHCPAKMAFCGLSTQVYFGDDDATAMDGVQIKCCNLPNPATVCIPTDQWDLIIECDNLEAISPTTCKYSKKVGTSNYTSTSENHWDIVESYSDLGFNLGGAAGPLLINFHTNLESSTTTGYNWTTSSSEMWNEEVTTEVTFEVPPRVRSELFQIFGSCGIYGARASRFKKVDTEATSNGLFKQSVTYFDA